MGSGSYDKTTAAQFVKIKGALGETAEKQCKASFDVINQDVTCSIESEVDIGEYRCIIWRTTGTDGWAFTKVSEMTKNF